MDVIDIQSKSDSRKNSLYRPEIDGLRAFAVLAVIINHFNKDILPAGYLGVDIFFVISGYVITSSLFQRKSKNFFDFISGFYERRIKRLIPALSFFVIINSIAICIVNPAPRVTLRTGLTSLFGISNLYLLKQSTDYFAQSTALNIFTHTWSLGVEEQFYIFFPLLIWFSGFGRQAKNGSRNLFLCATTLSIISLISFIYLYPNNQPAAYFLMTSRLWEMASGCLIFICEQKISSIRNLLKKVPALFVLILIIGAMYMPISLAVGSTFAVVALTSILLVTLNNKKDSVLFILFTNPKIVFIGVISYSLYLWHWGVISISRWTIGLHWWSIPFQIALIFFLSIVSFRWVETPFRQKFFFKRRLKTLLFGSGLIVSISGILLTLDQFPKGKLYQGNYRDATGDDYSEHFSATRQKCNANEYTTFNCLINSKTEKKQTLLLFGDSHAGHIIPLLGEVYSKTDIRMNITTFGNYPSIVESNNQGLTKNNSQKKISKVDKLYKNFISELKDNDIVILSSRWEHYLYEDFYNLPHKSRRRLLFSDNGQPIDSEEVFQIFEQKIEKIAIDLKDKNLKLIIFAPLPVFKGSQNPSPSWACTKEWFRPLLNKNCSAKYQESRKNIEKRNIKINEVFNRLKKKNKNIYIYDPFNLLCPSETICSTINNDIILFRDDDHLSRDGAKYLLPSFIDFLKINELILEKDA